MPYPATSQCTPSQNALVLLEEDGQRRFDFFQWGFIPKWADRTKDPKPLYNARAETLFDKMSFRSAAIHGQRCLMIAGHFSESKKSMFGERNFLFMLKSKRTFGMAGLWEVWDSPGQPAIKTCTLITTSPNRLVKEVHPRMPVILPNECYNLWLNPQFNDRKALQAMLRPYPEDEMVRFEISDKAESPVDDDRERMLPLFDS